MATRLLPECWGQTDLSEPPALLAAKAETRTTYCTTITCKLGRLGVPVLGDSVKIDEKAPGSYKALVQNCWVSLRRRMTKERQSHSHFYSVA